MRQGTFLQCFNKSIVKLFFKNKHSEDRISNFHPLIMLTTNSEDLGASGYVIVSKLDYQPNMN